MIGIKGKANSLPSNERMNRVCFDKVSEMVQDGHQVMVFVHARKETVKTAQMLKEEVLNEGIACKADESLLYQFVDTLGREMN
jgi:replicative superfamily II helicase